MLAIAQSNNQYHYLSWTPSESGPIVTHYGKVMRNQENIEHFRQHNYEVLDEIIRLFNDEEPICTISLDNKNFIFSTNYSDNNKHNIELNNWYQSQARDEMLIDSLEYYYYPMNTNINKILTIIVPQFIRQSIQYNIRKLEIRLNGISVGIFSAEQGARSWFHAEKLGSYIIWKVKKKKEDEILFIKNNQLDCYFSIKRSSKKAKINWYFGNKISVNLICNYIEGIFIKNGKGELPSEVIFLYTCDNNKQEIKNIEKQDKENITLLNPLSKLKSIEQDKIDLYETLPLAETGNAFGRIDV